MKTYLYIVVLLLFGSISGQQSTPKAAFIEKWENSKLYLLAVAEAMPETAYNYKPSERQMSFKEQLVHIKENMDWLGNSYFSAVAFDRDKTPLPDTKLETMVLLSEAFDSVRTLITLTPDEDLQTVVDFFSGPKSKLQILNLLQDHVTHHRGQLVVYLNLNDIEPPKYSGW